MANLITTTLQINGSNCFTAKIDIVGDGTGEAVAVKIIDHLLLNGAPATFKIRAIQWGTDGSFSSQLLWDATADVFAYEIGLPNGGIRFSDTGAHLVNNAGAGRTGDLLLSTFGLNATSRGTIIVEGIHAE